MHSPKIEDKLALLPDLPGVYRFISANGKIIYVGKAKSLTHRVRSYFNPSNRDDARIRNLLPNINDLKWTVTHNETEALLLEEYQIKTFKPRYNVLLKDDKSYPYFKLSVKELYPRLTLVRKVKKDGSLYFGPYVAVSKARAVWKIIKKQFPLRQSKMPLDGSKTLRPCLNYQMKKCLAPCAGLISPADYRKIVDNVIYLLKGNYKEVTRHLKQEMEKLSQNLDFEAAALVRDQIEAFDKTFLKQRIVTDSNLDRDILALVRSGGFAGVQVMFVRGGILISDDFFFFRQGEKYSDRELIRSCLSKLYFSGHNLLPDEIILPFIDAETTMAEEYFKTKRQARFAFIAPSRGEKKSLLDLAAKNGKQNLTIKMDTSNADDLILKEVKEKLHLINLPVTVECFDISNISGTHTVASMIRWENNKSCPKKYRKYKIKTVVGSNDYLCMEEVLGRRYRIKEGQDRGLPDLVVIDGGKGQISSAVAILNKLEINLDKIDLIGLAKGRSEKRRGQKTPDLDTEYVIKPNQKNEIRLPQNSSTLFFLQRIRDEAHRFAIEYHRKLRGKKALGSILEQVPGIGPKKRKILLQHFKTLDKIKLAKLSSLNEVGILSPKDAEEIYLFFQKENLSG